MKHSNRLRELAISLPPVCGKNANKPIQTRLINVLRIFRTLKTPIVDDAPDNALIAKFLTIKGITHPTLNTSLINFDNSDKDGALESVIHEGIHRLHGGNWARRSRIGLRFHYNGDILPPISRALDEGTVHIFTGLVVTELQRRNWLRNYRTSAYPGEVAYVRNILNTNGKNIDFLKNAYFTDRSDQDVELLQYWGSQTPL